MRPGSLVFERAISVLSLGREGLSLREIAIRLGLSHTTVINYRRNIARLASRLGLDESSTARLKRTALSAEPNTPFPQVRSNGNGAH